MGSPADDSGTGQDMVVRVDAVQAERLIAEGIRTLDVLPADVYRKVHLPGATSLPLESFEPTQAQSFDKSEPLLVYCYDQHCDLSARASVRLEKMGFERVHDLIGGRAAWTALGLPTEGEVGDQGRVGQYVDKAPAVLIDETISEVAALGEHRFPTPVVDTDGVLLGAVEPAAIELPASTPVRDVMLPAPRTIRPEGRVDEVVEQLRRDRLDHILVTAVNGVLFGRVVTDQLPQQRDQ
jgi:rhodanese-related sulfurtransferase